MSENHSKTSDRSNENRATPTATVFIKTEIDEEINLELDETPRNEDETEKFSLSNSGVQPVNCQMCNCSFTNIADLQTHTIEAHVPRTSGSTVDSPSLVCPHCELGFSSLLQFASHMKQHISTSPSPQATPVFLCQICGLSFGNEQATPITTFKDIYNYSTFAQSVRKYSRASWILRQSLRTQIQLKLHAHFHYSNSSEVKEEEKSVITEKEAESTSHEKIDDTDQNLLKSPENFVTNPELQTIFDQIMEEPANSLKPKIPTIPKYVKKSEKRKLCCGLAFKTKHRYERHLRKHDHIKHKVCQICGEKATNQEEHMKMHRLNIQSTVI
ncbi:hypothetical protein WR25_22194 [Diploscapter pachys]|uniref:C2H2-type domain-containing protein n=1 Tax=Diploscapter pachys TaxID=2018661 RepID=A0A2A2K202_9BILA|nr:hypothetical protein WR25_22194 [Diploscapter pachys]